MGIENNLSENEKENLYGFFCTFVEEDEAERLMLDEVLLDYCAGLACGVRVLLQDGKNLYVIQGRSQIYKTKLNKEKVL